MLDWFVLFSLVHDVIVAMRRPQCSGIACTEPLYSISIRQALRVQPKYRLGEPQCRELCMHRRGFVRSIDGGWISKRNVPNGHSSACQAPRPNMHHRIDGNDDPCFKHRTIEDRGTRRNKHAPM